MHDLSVVGFLFLDGLFHSLNALKSHVVLRSACERVTRSIALSSGLRALLDMHNSLNELAGRSKVSASVLTLSVG